MKSSPDRADALDALRGAAIVWMVAYHFCFDLNLYRWLTPVQQFNHDPLWTVQRTAIVSLFLLTAGMGQALAEAAGQGWPRFWRRWAQVAACAALVSLGSWWMFPTSWISFGVLHGLAAMLLLTRALARPLGNGPLLVLALVALALPWLVQHPAFDNRWLNGIGLVTRKPVTQDFVPLLPWWGVMLIGFVAGRHWAARRARAAAAWGAAPAVAPVAARPGLWPRLRSALAFLGRWPLVIYMLHQPLLLGGVWLASRLLRA